MVQTESIIFSIDYCSFGSLKHPSLSNLNFTSLLSILWKHQRKFSKQSYRINDTLHHLSLAYPQNIFQFPNLSFHFQVSVQLPYYTWPQFLFSPHSFKSIWLQMITLTTNSVQVRMLYFQIVVVSAHFASCSGCLFWQLIMSVSSWT